MARAQDVHVGQVWSDSQGRQFHVLGPQGQDGGFPVRNLATNRQATKGPRALVQLVQEAAPQQSYPQPYPPVYGLPDPFGGADTSTWGYGGPPVAPYMQEQFPAGDYEPPEPPPPRRRPPERQPAPAPSIAASVAAPALPPQPVYQVPQGFPSELCAHVANALRAMPPAHAHSPGLVSRAVAQALASWKVRRPGGR